MCKTEIKVHIGSLLIWSCDVTSGAYVYRTNIAKILIKECAVKLPNIPLEGREGNWTKKAKLVDFSFTVTTAKFH